MIFGESAGAGAVSNHVAMMKSWPYFRNAAMQSGGFQQWVAKSVAQASSNFEAFAARMGCTQKNTGVAAAVAVRDCLVAAPVKKIVDVSTGGVFPHDDSWYGNFDIILGPFLTKNGCRLVLMPPHMRRVIFHFDLVRL